MDTLNIIPQPLNISMSSGTFTLTPDAAILASAESTTIAEYLAQRFSAATGFALITKPLDQGAQTPNALILQTIADRPELGEEGYELSVKPDRVLITAYKPAGVFYACQTLLQLLPAEIESKAPVQGMTWTIPQVEIQDKPRFSWRGMHLDVCRHFMPTEFVKKYIDLLAAYKLNVFHWHLTEDQGWRIEIKQYPQLTDIGAWRVENGERYGGYYTQAEIRDVVEYARQRYITVVPEIEMPGHALAALAAYPELSCTGGPFTVATTWGIFEDVYCAGNEHTFEFLENVLAEVIDLFPSQYVHIGGDECPKSRWKTCPKCQARIAAEGLQNEEELQSYVIRRIEQFLLAQNRRLIGWDEILEGGLAPEATVMSWRGTEGGIVAAQLGHDVVMSPQSHCYFDHYQFENHDQEPKAIGGYTPLEKVYAYEPIPSELTAEQAQHVLGAQANMWTEYMPTPEHVEYMLLPRLCALAEVVWSAQEQRNLKDFLGRVTAHYARFETMGVKYRRY
jgi:hexosaminidase